MTYVRSQPDPQPLQRLHDAGRFREVVDRFLALEGAGDREALPLFLAASAAAHVGELEKAETWGQRAIAIYADNGDDRGVARATNVLGAVDFERGNLDPAVERFEEARQLGRRVGDLLTVARATNNLANVAHLRGQIERALRLYHAALVTYEAAGNHHGAAETWHNLALRFRELGALRDASHAAQQAVQRAERSDHANLVALCLTGAAGISIDRQEYAQADEQLDAADGLAWNAGDGLLALEIQRLRALIDLRSGHCDRAATTARGIRDVAQVQGAALIAAEATAIRALALKALGRGIEAEREREETMKQFRRIGSADLIERFELDWEEERVERRSKPR